MLHGRMVVDPERLLGGEIVQPDAEQLRLARERRDALEAEIAREELLVEAGHQREAVRQATDRFPRAR